MSEEDGEEWRKRGVKIYARMGKALAAGKGVRISHEELEVLETTFLGEVMADCLDEVYPIRTNPL